MDLKEGRKISKKMIANFVDEIGLDGEFYASLCNCPMTWGKIMLDAPGKYFAPGSKVVEKILQTTKCNEKTKEVLNRSGVILVNQSYKEKEPDKDFFVTIIHETFHSNRNLLIFDATRESVNEKAYNSNNGKFDQNTSKYSFSYADASQEILKGNIDTSKKTIDGYKNISTEELDDMEFAEGQKDLQLSKQYYVDEALVELMGALSYTLYDNKEKENTRDIWTEIEDISERYEGDISIMCKIILKHNDFELFNWMLDPITYSQGDIHYDFFGEYTKNDQELVQEFYKSVGIIEDEIPENEENYEITKENVEDVATSHLYLAQSPLLSLSRELRIAQKGEDIENERK